MKIKKQKILHLTSDLTNKLKLDDGSMIYPAKFFIAEDETYTCWLSDELLFEPFEEFEATVTIDVKTNQRGESRLRVRLSDINRKKDKKVER